MNSRFHAVLWPALLMAADLPLPNRFSIHGHWLSGGVKVGIRMMIIIIIPNDNDRIVRRED